MRKIESEMLAAIRAGKNWTSGNTRVDKYSDDGCAVYLHGNHIATIFEGHATANLYTLAHWPTATTKSRLRALGINVTTKKGVTFVDGKPV